MDEPVREIRVCPESRGGRARSDRLVTRAEDSISLLGGGGGGTVWLTSSSVGNSPRLSLMLPLGSVLVVRQAQIATAPKQMQYRAASSTVRTMAHHGMQDMSASTLVAWSHDVEGPTMVKAVDAGDNAGTGGATDRGAGMSGGGGRGNGCMAGGGQAGPERAKLPHWPVAVGTYCE